MVAANKFQDFVDQLGLKKHELNADLLKVALTNTAPVATNTILANITQIAGTFGYTTGGEDVTNTYVESAGTGTLDGTNIVWTASGGSIGPFQYCVLYNDTQTAPVDPLILWWDNGSAITLADGETFTFSITTTLATIV